MPPQAAVLGGALAGVLSWNYQRHLVGKKTISKWCREHPIATGLVLLGANGIFVPHIYLERP
jgi:hypothetical protein